MYQDLISLNNNTIDSKFKKKIYKEIIIKNKTAYVCIGLDNVGDNIVNIGIVRYLSSMYEIVYLAVLSKLYDTVSQFYLDNENIKILKFDSKIDAIKYNTGNDDLYVSYKYILKQKEMKHFKKNFGGVIPFFIYTSFGIPPCVFWEYFKIPDIKTPNIDLLTNKKYAFVHTCYSLGELIKVSDIEKIYNISKDDVIIIDPNINHYDVNDKFYSIASKFIELKTILQYKDLISNADYIYLSDSSFFMLASQLELKCKNPYVYLRKRTNSFRDRYNDYINHKYLKEGLNKGKFTIL